MRNAALFPLFLCALAIALVYLRWVLFTQWTCRKCSTPHIDCECKPAWLKMLL
jgi:hypothetical protein